MLKAIKEVGYPRTINFLLSNLCSHIQQSDRRCQVWKPQNSKEVFVWAQSKFLRTILQPSCLKPMLPTPASPAPHPTPTPFAFFSLQEHPTEPTLSFNSCLMYSASWNLNTSFHSSLTWG